MENRKREHRIFFRVSGQELKIISERMKLTGMQNREAFLRKISLDGYILNIDLSDLKKIVILMSNVSNNLNQIAKRVNISENIYKNDIKELQSNYEKLFITLKETLNKLLELQE